MKTALAIAGFDPSSGAGITADLATMQAHGLFGTSCITALTVQSTVGVRSWRAAGAALVEQTLECLADDLPPAGVKIGMLADAETVRTVSAFVRRLPAGTPIVLDPVLQSSSGRLLLEPDGLQAVLDQLLHHVSWVTPNLQELALLAGMRVETRAETETAAGDLCRRFPGLSVVATGGDLPEPDDCAVLRGRQPVWLPGQKLHTRATHGTGCAFSTALLCGLVQRLDGLSAAAAAKSYVFEAMRRAPRLGRGKGPMNLLWPLQSGS